MMDVCQSTLFMMMGLPENNINNIDDDDCNGFSHGTGHSNDNNIDNEDNPEDFLKKVSR